MKMAFLVTALIVTAAISGCPETQEQVYIREHCHEVSRADNTVLAPMTIGKVSTLIPFTSSVSVKQCDNGKIITVEQ